MIKVCIFGHAGADAELRKAGQSEVCSFRVGANEDTKERETMWFEVSVWGAYGVALADHIRKGDPITVCGSLTEQEHEGKFYKKIKADTVALVGGKSERGEERGGRDSRRDERGGREERSSRDDRGGREERSSRSSRDDRDTRGGRGGSRHEDDILFG